MAESSAIRTTPREVVVQDLTKENILRAPTTGDASFKFSWELKNFHKNLFEFGQPVRSPEFSLQSFGSSKYCFELYACGKTQEQKDASYVALYLIQTQGDQRNVRFSCFLLPNAKGAKKAPEADPPQPQHTNFVPMKNAAWVHPRDKFPDGDFGLEIEIVFENAVDGDPIDADSIEKLSSDLGKAYDGKLYRDEFIIADCKLYRVHQAIVEARCPQLLSESFLGRSVINLVYTQDFLEKLLRYVYTGKLDRGSIPIGFYDILSKDKPPEMQSILFASPRQIRAETCFTAKNISFPWIIRNFSSLKGGETVSCFFFADEHSSWTRFQAFFRLAEPSGAHSSEASFAISLRRYSEMCKFIVCLVRINGSKKLFRHRFGSEDEWEIPSFATKESLLQSRNDELTINFEICVMDGSYSSNIKKTYIRPLTYNIDDPFAHDLKQLQTDMRKLFLDSKFSDLKVSAGKEVFDVHKFVLCARSPLFRSLIEQHSASIGDPLVVGGCESPVLKSMLKFIYSADVDVTDFDHALKVYFAAHTFEILGLEKACAEFLKYRLTPENAVRVLVTADDCSDEGLVSHVIEYIFSNCLWTSVSNNWGKLKDREQLLQHLLKASFKHSARVKE